MLQEPTHRIIPTATSLLPKSDQTLILITASHVSTSIEKGNFLQTGDANGSPLTFHPFLHTILDVTGYSVQTAEEAAEATEAFRRHKPDLVVLDLNLPQKSGFTLLKDVFGGAERTPVLVFTGHGDDAVIRRRAEELGAAAFLGKDAGTDALLRSVARILSGRQGPGKTERHDYILVVDDDPAICELLKDFLEDYGYRVETVNDAKSGRELIERACPRLLLLDIKMPEVSGLELLEELEADGIRPPTMVITGAEEKEIGIEAESYGIIDFLVKPFNFNYLESHLLAQIERL